MLTGLKPYLAFLLVALTGCGTGSVGIEPTEPAAQLAERAFVSDGDVVSVVTLDATVVASPIFAIVSPTAGVVEYTAEAGETTNRAARVVGSVGSSSSAEIFLPSYSRLLEFTIAEGGSVQAGLPVAVAQYVGFAIRATVPPTDIHRFSATPGPIRVQVEDGPGPFDCPALGTVGSGTQPPTAGPPLEAAPVASPLSVEVLCTPPRDLEFFTGERAIMAVVAAEAHNVPTLPTAAVAGTTQRGLVNIVDDDGTVRQRRVELGITDGVVIEIRSGLEVGDEVTLPAPDLGDPSTGQ